MSLGEWCLFALASAAGGLLRWTAARPRSGRFGPSVPSGTTLVNTVGSLGLGLLVGVARSRGLDDRVLVVVGAGFCGSLTTFSTFAVETLDDVDRAGPLPAAGRLVVSVLVPLAAAGIGLAVAAALAG